MLQLLQQKCAKILSLLGSLRLTRSENFVEASTLTLQIDKLIVLPWKTGLLEKLHFILIQAATSLY
jgi:hypothetical protein